MKESEWSEKLRQWYASAPALTHALTHKYLTTVGCNTYEYLSQALDEVACESPRVLDLACGGGELYPYCQPRLGNGYWVGIDFVPEQVEASQRRFAGVDFRCENAAATSLTESDVDAVLCHLALGEMSPLDSVVDEVDRVLRPGGIFAGIVQAQQDEAGEWNGDPRAHTQEGLISLFDARFETPRLDRYDLIVEDTIENLWSLVSQRSYKVGMLAPPEKARRREETLAQLQAIAKDGLVKMLVPGHRVIVQKRGKAKI